MKSYSIKIFILFCILSCNEKKEKVERYKYSNGKKIVIETNPSTFYGYRKFYDSISNTYLGFEKYHYDTLISQLTLSYQGDTILFFDGQIFKDYKNNVPISWLFTLESINGKSRMNGLIFDSLGKITYNVGDLGLYNKSDSAELTHFYPDWEAQVRIWNEKKKPTH